MGFEAVNRDVLCLVAEQELEELGSMCQHGVGAAVLRRERWQISVSGGHSLRIAQFISESSSGGLLHSQRIIYSNFFW